MRVPVVDKNGNPLMPTKPSRVRRWLKEGKAIKHWSDVGVFYVQLTCEPSDVQTQDVVVGVDPGKHFSGVAVQSANFTLFMAHLVLPFETVKKRMEQRRMMRRTRRSRRINRDKPFEQRSHRQKRFYNRRGHKLPPSIRANRELELRVIKELAAIFPVNTIVYERVKARGDKGFSPVMVGQNFAVKALEAIAPVTTLKGWETANLRRHLGLKKTKDKASQTPESHAVDGVALAASEFVSYQTFNGSRSHGKQWVGGVNLTDCVFKVIRRPPICRRQLHLLQFSKGSKRRRYGGTVTRHGFRKGDFVKAEKASEIFYGWVSGDTKSQVSVSDIRWKRLGHFSATKVELIQRSTGLLVV